MLTTDEIKRRVNYHPPTEKAKLRHGMIREVAESLLTFTESLIPEGREKAMAISKAEEWMMWANAAVARNHGVL